MKNGILPIIFASFAAYCYVKDYINSTIKVGFYDEFMEKREESSSPKKHMRLFDILCKHLLTFSF